MHTLHRLISALLGFAVALAGLGIMTYATTDLLWSDAFEKNVVLGQRILSVLPSLVLFIIAFGGLVMSLRFLRFAAMGKNVPIRRNASQLS
jgi:hypothetical protein